MGTSSESLSALEQKTDDALLMLLNHNVSVRSSFDAAIAVGMSEEHALKSVICYLASLNYRTLGILTDAIMYGMPVTPEVADVRNRIVGATKY
jgi:hypothetical protein